MAAYHDESGGRNGEPLGQSRSAAERLIADRAHEELRDLIVTLKLAPGALLREDDLMARLGVGRTPLRDAIKRLSLEGLVAVQTRRDDDHPRPAPRAAGDARARSGVPA